MRSFLPQVWFGAYPNMEMFVKTICECFQIKGKKEEKKQHR
jgi:hypothetical protein